MSKTVLIKQNPYTKENPFLGMEEYNMSMWDGTTVLMDVPMKGNRYVHGLTKDEVEELKSFDKLGIDLDSEEGQQFLADFQISIPSRLSSLDLDNPRDFLSLKILQASGNIIAPSKGEATTGNVKYGFYIQNKDEEARSNNITLRTVNQAITKIENLSIENPEFFLAVCKFILPDNVGLGTNVDVAYSKINEFVRASLDGAKRFLDAINENVVSKHKIYITNDIKTAIRKNVIRKNQKGYYYNPMTNTEYGKNLEEVINFLMDVKNIDEMGTGENDDANYSIKYQLKFK